MSLAKAGIPKSLNIKAQSGSLNAMKASFASATRAQGVSYGIMAQRSIFSTNALTNPKLAYSPEVASIRGQLNPPRPLMFADVMPHQHHNSGYDTMNKFMMGMMALNTLSEMTAGITKGIKDIKASKAEKNPNTEAPKQEKSNNIPTNTTTTTFTELEKTKEQIGTRLTSFSSNYKSCKGQLSTITSLGEGIELPETAKNALGKLDINSNFEINLNKDSELNDISSGIETVSTDLQAIDSYLGNIDNAMSAIDTEINKLDSNAQDYTMQKAKLETAKQALDKQLKTQVSLLKNKVNEQKGTLEAIKETKIANMDAIFDKAMKDDTQIKQNNAKMETLKEQIENADKKDKKKLVKDYNSLANQNKELALNLKDYKQVKSSTGTSYTTLTETPLTDEYKASDDK